MIGVVIPFYQKTAGLLGRALRSVAAQTGGHDLRVYVVDDGSPALPAPELANLPVAFAQRITILHQRNAGPGAARNLALDSIPDDISAVAFLDSDDAWHADHLTNAMAALAAGADFYFADHQREDDAQSRFTQCSYIPKGPAVAGGKGALAWCDREYLFRMVVLRSPVGTSTVVLRRMCIGQIRFPTRLRAAGEDSIFWLELLSGNTRAACGKTCEAAYGRGVSVFNHRSWGDIRSLQSILDQMQAHLYMRDHFRLDSTLIVESEAQCRNLDVAFCTALIACGRRLQWNAAGPAGAYMGRRPQVLLQFPRAVLRAVRRKRRESPMGHLPIS